MTAYLKNAEEGHEWLAAQQLDMPKDEHAA